MNTMLNVSDITDVTMSLVSKIEEATRLGFNANDGAKLVGIYDDGYRAIAMLIAVRDRHSDPVRRKQAYDLLAKVDEQNGTGKLYTEIRVFLKTAGMTNKKTHSWTSLRQRAYQTSMDERLIELKNRPDIGNDVKTKVDELLSSIVSGRMPTHLYNEAHELLKSHRITKVELKRRKNSSASSAHALEHACKACENLMDVDLSTVITGDRSALILRICEATRILLDIQHKLIGGQQNDD